jgi:hypothetical protein
MIENELAEFTDQILDESSTLDKIPLTPDPKLRALEQTVLQLKNTFKEDGPSEAVIQRMRQNIVMQWKQQESNVSLPFWKKLYSLFKPDRQKWQSQRNRQRWNVAISLATVAVLMLIGIPLLNKVSSSQPAASGQNLNVSVVAAFGGLILLAVWFLRRR